jgi:hypothetical protein
MSSDISGSHPADFHRLEALDTLLADAATTDPIVFGDAAIAAHRAEESPGSPVTDPAPLAALFGYVDAAAKA